MNKKLIVILIVALFVMWYAPLTLQAGLERYGVEEMRVAINFFIFGVLVAYIWLTRSKKVSIGFDYGGVKPVNCYEKDGIIYVNYAGYETKIELKDGE